MDQFWTGILGGLIGSTLTVAITKVLDLFAASREHKFKLEKRFFDHKLAAAEAAVTQSGIFSNALMSLGALFDRLADGVNNSVETSMLESLQKQVTMYMDQANNASFIIGNSLSLYFDSKHQVNQNEILKDVLSNYGAIGPLQDTYNTAVSAYQAAVGTDQEQALLQNAQQAFQNYNNALRQASASLQTVQQVMQLGIMDIRSEMRKFEY